MKKLLLLLAVVLLSSCGNPSKEVMYTNAVKTVYNFNKLPVKITSSDTLVGLFNVYKEGNTTNIKDESSDFKIDIHTNPNIFKLKDFNGKEKMWEEKNGYQLGNEMIGDTLILKYMPVETKDPGVLKLGFEYKFYK